MLSRRVYYARPHRPASPSASDRILDDTFLAFLLTHVNSPTINPDLRFLLSMAGIPSYRLELEAGNDLVAVQNEVFLHTPAEGLRACIPDGSEVKRELRRYPAAFARIWPDEQAVLSEGGKVGDEEEEEEVSDTDLEENSRRPAGWLAGGMSKRKRAGFDDNTGPDTAVGPRNAAVRMVLRPDTGMSRAETGSNKRARLRGPRHRPSVGVVEVAPDASVEEGLLSATPVGEGDLLSAGELGDGKDQEKSVFQGVSVREAPKEPTLWRDVESPIAVLDEPKTKETEREMEEKEKEKLREAQVEREIIELFEQQMEKDEVRLEEITLEESSGRLPQDKEKGGAEAHEGVHAAEDEAHTIVWPVGRVPEGQDNEIKDTTPRTSPAPGQFSENAGQSNNNNPFAAHGSQVIIPKKYKYAPSPPPFPPLSPDIIPDYAVPLPPVEMVDDDELLRGATAVDRESWEWIREMDYEGTPQPPLAVRLEHVLNFLREEDPDRLLEFEKKLQETQDFVAWLEHGEGRELMDRANQVVWSMFFDVQRKIAGHQHFQGVMFGVVPPGDGIKSVDEVPKPTRGKRPVITGARAIQIAEQQEPDDGPRRLLVAPAHRVHTQFTPMDRRQNTPTGEATVFLNQLGEAEHAFWTWEDHDDPDKSYLYRLENAAYDTLTAPDGPLVRYKTKQGQLILPQADKLPSRQAGGEIGPPGSVERQAVEHGARRAALQQALRHFTNSEQTLAGSRYNRVVPAIEGTVLDEVRADVDRNHQWDLPKLSRRPVPKEKLETMPYTVWWRQQKKVLADLAVNVRRIVEEQHSEARGWVTLPMGVINGGPFVWRGVDPDVQKDQDLLRECEEVFRAIVRAPRVPTARHPKPLLDEIQRLALRPAVIELLEAGRWEKLITPDELRWLRFLTGNSANEEMLAAAAAAKEKQQPKLYGVFAARLQKAIDDRSEAGHFPDTEKWVSVEELLDVINRGCGGDTGKVVFSPPQAMYFLERAVKQGICRYTPDPTAHGHIARSIRPIEPLDRVAGTIDYNTADEANPLLQATYPSDITSFLSLPEPDSDPDIAREEALIRSRFFRELGKRLGLTLHRILQRKHGWHGKGRQPLDTEHLRRALYTFRQAYRTVRDETDEEGKGKRQNKPPLTLVGFVEGFDPEGWAKWLSTVLPQDEVMRTPEKEAEAKEEAAMDLIRQRILLEAHENKSLLGRGRQAIYTSPHDGSQQTVWTRDFNWDWAAEEARGNRGRFFSLDRWPLELQSEKTRSRITADEDVDREMVSDPLTEDPVPREYYFREKLRPYEEERVERIRGPAEYLLGDTRLQRRKVEKEMREMIEGVDPDAEKQKPKTWKETLASLIGLRRSPSPGLDGGWVETSLPEVDPKMVPKSWTPPPEYYGSQPGVEDSAMEKRAEAVAESVEGEDDDVPMMDLVG